MEAALTVLLLAVMEVSLSFDNAVVNASVLQKMAPVWQRRFLTWGILVAVFGMRLIFPVLIVACASGLGLVEVATLALNQPDIYGQQVTEAHVPIASFGGMFLLLVFLHFVCDQGKEVHWLRGIESRLATIGRLESAQVMLALTALAIVNLFLPHGDRVISMLSGVIGIILYIAIKGASGAAAGVGGLMMRSSAMGFVYLEILDASFSLDGVVAAFAITNDIAVIMLGLGIGALCIRSMTVSLVRKGTLQEFIYLEHGAHWGIGCLAAIMLVSLLHPVSEIVTGMVGVGCILAALASSVSHKRRLA